MADASINNTLEPEPYNTDNGLAPIVLTPNQMKMFEAHFGKEWVERNCMENKLLEIE